MWHSYVQPQCHYPFLQLDWRHLSALEEERSQLVTLLRPLLVLPADSRETAKENEPPAPVLAGPITREEYHREEKARLEKWLKWIFQDEAETASNSESGDPPAPPPSPPSVTVPAAETAAPAASLPATATHVLLRHLEQLADFLCLPSFPDRQQSSERSRFWQDFSQTTGKPGSRSLGARQKMQVYSIDNHIGRK
ncbi:hypothetical protein MUG91_G234n14 [Manis pentadactyla]|nr:hypothetical protein MUG91_G234n14 [Manis pentadactyla]